MYFSYLVGLEVASRVALVIISRSRKYIYIIVYQLFILLLIKLFASLNYSAVFLLPCTAYILHPMVGLTWRRRWKLKLRCGLDPVSLQNQIYTFIWFKHRYVI